MRPTVYIAGPYAAATPELIEQNIQRAQRLGRFAVAQGFAPIVPHTLGASGLYGSPTEQDDGTSRRVALECSEALAAGCSRLWLILRDDREPSDGCLLELDAWSLYHPFTNCRSLASSRGLAYAGLRGTWPEWLEVME